MASPFTRSSGKTQSLSTRSSKRNNVAIVAGHHNRGTQEPPNIGRKKRLRDVSANTEVVSFSRKKAKITIGISSRPPKTSSLVEPKTTSELPPRSPLSPSPSPLRSPSPQLLRPKTQLREPAAQTLGVIQLPHETRKDANNQLKIINRIKDGLDQLQPKVEDLPKGEKRKLRSQEGTWFKSELSAYFPEYDEVIGNEPKEDHVLNVDTPIEIIDTAKTSDGALSKTTTNYKLQEFPKSLFTELHNAERVDFSFLDGSSEGEGGEDRLTQAYFESMHKKPERAERTIRNTEKGRAQHERDQIIRLLRGLQGHDWLKLMGVSGVTDSKKKEFEPAREHFIRGCEAIIEKFRLWREEEKRRKIEKEAALAEEVGKEVEEEGDKDEFGFEANVEEDVPRSRIEEAPVYSHNDTSAARQFQPEPIARTGSHDRSNRKAKSEAPTATWRPTCELEKEFRSFFAKRHLRDAALGKQRRSFRSVMAWGHPVPDMAEHDFDLPEEYRDEETLKAHARKRRRDRRVSKN